MNFPQELQKVIESYALKLSLKDVRLASEELTKRYRIKKEKDFFLTQEQVAAYLIVRFPATYAAIAAAMTRVQGNIESYLDLGSGPGTGAWVVKELFPAVKKNIAIERNRSMVELGKFLEKQVGHSAIEWQLEDVLRAKSFPQSDMISCCYFLNEVDLKERNQLLKKAWEACQKTFVIVEPGTMEGYRTVISARDFLIGCGGFTVAPCPHDRPCPMEKGDWCHFPQRVERTFYHRYVKKGSLPFEDEKFSYVVISKEKFEPCKARILNSPMKRSGHTIFRLCKEEGIVEETISKKMGEKYLIAKKKKAGDCL